MIGKIRKSIDYINKKQPFLLPGMLIGSLFYWNQYIQNHPKQTAEMRALAEWVQADPDSVQDESWAMRFRRKFELVAGKTCQVEFFQMNSDDRSSLTIACFTYEARTEYVIDHFLNGIYLEDGDAVIGDAFSNMPDPEEDPDFKPENYAAEMDQINFEVREWLQRALRKIGIAPTK